MSEIKIVRGNTFATRTHVRAFRIDGTEIQDFDLSACENIKAYARAEYVARKELQHTVLSGNYLRAVFPAEMQHVGKYGLEVTGTLRGIEWRFFDRHILTIVESNAEASIPQSSIIDDDYYEVNGAVLILSDPYDDTEVRGLIQQLQSAAASLALRTEALEGTARALDILTQSLLQSAQRLSDRITPLEGGDFH